MIKPILIIMSIGLQRIVVNVVCHFYREGLFNVGDHFVQEAHVPNAANFRSVFMNMHQILEAIRRGNLEPSEQFYSLLGQPSRNPLSTVVLAGLHALSVILKMARVLSATNQNW